MRQHPPTPPSDHDDAALLERLRELARQRDGVPEDVLAAARSVFLAARDGHAGDGPESGG